MHPLLRRLGLKVSPVKRVVAQRDSLLAENAALRRQLRDTPAPFEAIRSGHHVGSLCSVVNPSHWLDPEWLAIHHDLSRYSIDRHCFQNLSGEILRKGWEWTHCLYGLHKLGMLKPEHRAVGVGVGRECVIYYLADHITQVTATDLYGEAAWSTSGGKEADLDLLAASKAQCPDTVDFSKIAFENQDGTQLTYKDDSFDFAWSLSSIEHFGGHEAAKKAVEEMARVVRPGGILAIATEWLVLEEYSHPEFFNRAEVMRYLVGASSKLELISPIDFHTLTYEYLVDTIVYPAGIRRLRRHVILNDGQVQSTSIFLFLRVLA